MFLAQNGFVGCPRTHVSDLGLYLDDPLSGL